MAIKSAELVYSILSFISKKGGTTLDELADHFKMSPRNLQRYLKVLREHHGLEFDRNTGKYIIKTRNHQSTTVPLDFREKVLLEALIKFFENSAPEFAEILQSIRKKLNLLTSDLSNLMKIREHKSAKVGDILNKILLAFEKKTNLDIIYKSLKSEITRRHIIPIQIILVDGLYYLLAYCYLRGAIRMFAIDRIISAEILQSPIDSTNYSGDNLMLPDISKSWNIFVGKKVHKVKIKVHPEITEKIERKPKWHESEERTTCEDGSLILSYEICGLEEIRAWILQWIPYVEVLEPAELRNQIINDLKEALKLLEGYQY